MQYLSGTLLASKQISHERLHFTITIVILLFARKVVLLKIILSKNVHTLPKCPVYVDSVNKSLTS